MNLGETAIYGTVPQATATMSFVHTAFRNHAPTTIRNKAIQSSGARIMVHLSISARYKDRRRCRAHRDRLRPCQAWVWDDELPADGESTGFTVGGYSADPRRKLDWQLCRAVVR